jgi:hypothetical protein
MNEPNDSEYGCERAVKDGNTPPQRKLADEKPPGVTIDYDGLPKAWKAQAQAPKKI